MLMQPQNQPSQTPASNSDPNYNFIFNNQQQPGGRKFSFKLPGGGNLTKIVLLVVGGTLILGVLIVILSSAFGNKGVDSKQLIDLAAKAQEISRVSDLVVQKSKDLNTINLAATTSNSLISEQSEIVAYVNGSKKKVASKDLRIYQNKNTDAAIEAAIQTNSLSTYYNSYLKQSLQTYDGSLKSVLSTTNSAKLKPILLGAISNIETILATSQVAKATAQ